VINRSIRGEAKTKRKSEGDRARRESLFFAAQVDRGQVPCHWYNLHFFSAYDKENLAKRPRLLMPQEIMLTTRFGNSNHVTVKRIIINLRKRNRQGRFSLSGSKKELIYA
jgi:hypothetical protein